MCQRNCAVYKMVALLLRLNDFYRDDHQQDKTIGEAVQRLVRNLLPSQSLSVAATNVSNFLVHFNCKRFFAWTIAAEVFLTACKKARYPSIVQP